MALYHLPILLTESFYWQNENQRFQAKKGNKQKTLRTYNTDADDADDIVLLGNTPTEAETQLHNLERAAADIVLHINANETEYMRWHLHTKRYLKLEDKFTYLGSSASSTETDNNTRLGKASKAINRLSVI